MKAKNILEASYVLAALKTTETKADFYTKLARRINRGVIAEVPFIVVTSCFANALFAQEKNYVKGAYAVLAAIARKGSAKNCQQLAICLDTDLQSFPRQARLNRERLVHVFVKHDTYHQSHLYKASFTIALLDDDKAVRAMALRNVAAVFDACGNVNNVNRINPYAFLAGTFSNLSDETKADRVLRFMAVCIQKGSFTKGAFSKEALNLAITAKSESVVKEALTTVGAGFAARALSLDDALLSVMKINDAPPNIKREIRTQDVIAAALQNAPAAETNGLLNQLILEGLNSAHPKVKAAAQRNFKKCVTLSCPTPTVPKPKVEVLGPEHIGKMIGDKGIYFGSWQPKDRGGKLLGKKFNVFAAPEDLDPSDTSGKNCRTFENAAKEVGNRRNWHGYDGIYCENDTALYGALKDGSAIGKWFIPTRDLLHGKDVDEKDSRDKHLYGLQNEGDFKGTFTTEDNAPSPMVPNYYWSCTERRDFSTHVWGVRFSDGVVVWRYKGYDRLSCRPCRVELTP
ncbi:MAG: hypothetical protein WC612_01545 [Bdellovibrionales bacterium]|jgi:hypothetical protein